MVVNLEHSADDPRLKAFIETINARGVELYRDLPWRNTRDPYEVLVSEVMLQQTQVTRVLEKWPKWLERFPTIDAVAAAELPHVLEEWRGLGYNRRAIALKRAAESCSHRYGGLVPQEYPELLALPGVGPATAAGVRAFAFELPGIYLETNVRTVVLHELFPGEERVSDSAIVPILEQTCDARDPRRWYYAMLDYGAHLKKSHPNPSRRSRHHTTQSRFEGSHRQKRSWLLREVMDAQGLEAAVLTSGLSQHERAAGRDSVSQEYVDTILSELSCEGFLVETDGRWFVA